MEYSAVIHPPVTFCSFIQRGTDSSTVTPQITRVSPNATNVDPVAYGAMPFWNRTGRSCPAVRPSARELLILVKPCVIAHILVRAAARGNQVVKKRKRWHFSVISTTATKRILVASLFLTAAGIFIARRNDVAAAVGLAKGRVTPKATVEDRLRAYETGANTRLAPALEAKGFSYPLKSFTLLAIKDASLLQLFGHDASGRAVHIKDYAVLAESGTLGPKLREGDGQIPEGIYKVTFLNPNSLYHLSLRLDYPNEFDRKMAARDGRTKLGGDIMIHGKDVSIGCIAVGDPAIEEIFCLAARSGVQNIKVLIVPTDGALKLSTP